MLSWQKAGLVVPPEAGDWSTFHVFLAEGTACHASGGPLSSDGKGRKVAGASAPDPGAGKAAL